MPMKFKKGVDLSGQRAQNAADGSSATDLVTLQQLQAAIRGLDWKDSVRVAASGNINTASPGASIDGVTMATNDRVLLRGQSTGSQNGIWVWNGAAVAMTRAVDADSNAEVTSGMSVSVEEGTDADKAYMLTTNAPITLNTTSLSFSILGGGSTAKAAGNGLTEDASNYHVGAGNGITVAADAISVDPSIVARKYAADCAATTNPQTFTHGLGTDIQVEIWETNEKVFPDITKAATSGGQVTIDWGSAPTAAQYRVVVFG